MPRSADTLVALQNVLCFSGLPSNGPFFDLLLELEEAAWLAGYEAAKAGYERMLPSEDHEQKVGKHAAGGTTVVDDYLR